VEITFRAPVTLSELPSARDLDGTKSTRFEVASGGAVTLRRPDFVVYPAGDHETLRRNFDVGEIRFGDVVGYALADATVLGENVVVLPDRTFLDATLGLGHHAAIRERPWRTDLRPVGGGRFESKLLDGEPVERQETAVLLASAGVSLYHHFLFDAVTKLCLLGEAELHEFVVAVPGHVPEPVLELLSAFGIENGRIVRTELATPTRFRRLLVLPRVATAQVMLPEVLQEARRRILTRAPLAAGERKILLTRRDAPEGARQLLNEIPLIDLFRDRGFVPVAPGLLTPLEQAALVHRADRIVAVHGSGAANILFARDSARVMHIHPADAAAFRQHGQVSAVRDQFFGYVFGDGFSSRGRLHNVEWLVDVDEVARTADEHGF
jgi:hypothetical protein